MPESARIGKRGLARRDVILPAWYDNAVNERMAEQGVGRSEIVRQMIREALQNRERINRLALKRLAAMLRLNIAAIRLTPGKLPEALRAMDCTVEEIEKLAE